MADPFTLEAYMPSGEFEHLRPAWAACLQWCIGEPDMLKQFHEDTGCPYEAPRNALDAIIDKATGAEREFVERFLKWFNAMVWGPLP